jgi:transcriptional regulator with XRE-family HTH domain
MAKNGIAGSFGRNLRRKRLARKLSQQALATKAGISVSFQSMLERGNRSPALDTIDQLAKALAVKPLDLLRG